MAGLHRHGDIEAELVVDPADSGQHQVLGAALAGAVNPDQPRPRTVGVPAHMHHRARRATQALGLQRLRQRRVMLERHSFVGESADTPPLYRGGPQRCGLGMRAIDAQS